jgi:isoleucyl-tRNA synthetase
VTRSIAGRSPEAAGGARILSAMPRYAPVSSRARFADAELEILEHWRTTKVFERTLEWRRDKPRYVFYEGPPTANGLPGLHHVISRAFKDVFARHRAMTGHYVERKAGWDTHGLPVELEVEKSLKISGKKQIEEFGVEQFNALCRSSVNTYIDQWREMSERIGFWLDFDHPYRTYDSTYIESVWWSLKQLWDRELLYQGYRVTPYCPRCQTSLSSHELSQGYREDTPDPSVYASTTPMDPRSCSPGRRRRGRCPATWRSRCTRPKRTCVSASTANR